jgi:hypothetical protein
VEATLGQLLQKVQDPRIHFSGALCKIDPLPDSPITSTLIRIRRGAGDELERI